jgi:hypothetical protein
MTVTAEPQKLEEEHAGPIASLTKSARDEDRHKFTVAVSIGFLAVTVPFLWTLWDLWTGTVNPFRQVVDTFGGSIDGNLYDEQARAMLSGHLSVPNGSIAFEAFGHGGHQYTYFGLFPSILRMPILFVAPGLSGKLTAPSMLLAWTAIGVITSLLLWRVRMLLRGPINLSWSESSVYGVLVAAMTGGTVLMVLAAAPWVFNEELLWSVALTLGSVFALLGVLERPSTGRVVASAVFVLCAALNRGSTGYACILAALLVAGWFALGNMGVENRRWSLPLLGIGLVPAAILAVVNLVKFGHVLGFSESEQLWTHIDAHRQAFLAANHNDPFGAQFLPSTLLAYFRPDGIGFSSLFPFITLPTSHASIVGNVAFDETDPTLSLPASMPLLLLLAVWGTVTAFRPHSVGRAHLTRLLLVATAAGCLGVLLFGFIANRYLADFLPFLVFGSMIGAVDLCRRLSGRSRPLQYAAGASLVVLALLGLWANTAAAIGPAAGWTSNQALSYVNFEDQVGGAKYASQVLHVAKLPVSAPAGTVADVGNCDGLYFSTEKQNSDLVSWRNQHSTWVAAERDDSLDRVLTVTFTRSFTSSDAPVVLMSYGSGTLTVVPAGPDLIRLSLRPSLNPSSQPIRVRPNVGYRIETTIDRYIDSVDARGFGVVLGPNMAGSGKLTVYSSPAVPDPTGLVTVKDVTPRSSQMELCQRLARQVHRS